MTKDLERKFSITRRVDNVLKIKCHRHALGNCHNYHHLMSHSQCYHILYLSSIFVRFFLNGFNMIIKKTSKLFEDDVSKAIENMSLKEFKMKRGIMK